MDALGKTNDGRNIKMKIMRNVEGDETTNKATPTTPSLLLAFFLRETMQQQISQKSENTLRIKIETIVYNIEVFFQSKVGTFFFSSILLNYATRSCGP